MTKVSKTKAEKQSIGCRYWHYKSGPFFDAVIEQEAKDKAIRGTWFDFAKRVGGIPATMNGRCSGVIFKEVQDVQWRSTGTTINGSPVCIPHGVTGKALKKEFAELARADNLAKIGGEFGFETMVCSGRCLYHLTVDISGKAPDQIVYVRAYQSEDSKHKPPKGGNELLTWQWEKWLHDNREGASHGI